IDSLLEKSFNSYSGPSPSKRSREEAKDLSSSLLDCFLSGTRDTVTQRRRSQHSDDESVHGFPVGPISSLLPPPGLSPGRGPRTVCSLEFVGLGLGLGLSL